MDGVPGDTTAFDTGAKSKSAVEAVNFSAMDGGLGAITSVDAGVQTMPAPQTKVTAHAGARAAATALRTVPVAMPIGSLVLITQ